MKPIPGTNGYFVDEKGNVFSSWFRVPGGNCVYAPHSTRRRKLRPGLSVGYPLVCVRFRNGRYCAVHVHTLVARAFIGPRPKGQDVRHLDDNELNNRPSNLAYGTRKMNMADAFRNGLGSHPPLGGAAGRDTGVDRERQGVGRRRVGGLRVETAWKEGAMTMGTFDDSMVPFEGEEQVPRNGVAHMPAGMIKTQTEYQTALAVVRPRDLKDVEARVLSEAARMGTDFVYSWRVSTKDKKLDEGDGKTTIEGMSIDGAMVLARNWGNCAVPIRLEQESDTHFVLRADFIDLETGFSFPRLYRQRKNQGRGGNMDADRAEDIAFQIGQSKAQRNVIDKALPEWLIDRATMAAKSAALKKYGNVEEWRPKVIAAFKTKYGVEESRLVARMRKPVDQWTPVEILKLDMIFRALKDSETTVGEEFAVGEGAASSETAKTIEEALKAKGAAPQPASVATPPDAPEKARAPRKPRAETSAAPQGAPKGGTAQQPELGAAPPPPATSPPEPSATPTLAERLAVAQSLVAHWSVPVGGAVVHTDPKTGVISNTTTASMPRIFGEVAVINVNDGQGGTQMVDLKECVPFS